MNHSNKSNHLSEETYNDDLNFLRREYKTHEEDDNNYTDFCLWISYVTTCLIFRVTDLVLTDSCNFFETFSE